jgi:hypothetical protein
MCLWHGVGNDPTSNTSTGFETFALPWFPNKKPGVGHEHWPVWEQLDTASRELNEQRERWLIPPEWIEPVSTLVDIRD